MLQQTQVKTALPYFKKFTTQIPSLKKLAKTNKKKILKLWEGLGYYRRARNLLETSKILVKKYKSILPKDYNELVKFPGIGDYTANILLALIHNKPAIALDGNVKRVFSRILNKNEKTINFKKLIEKNRYNLFKTNRNSAFAEALMEFGALVCKPQEPNCSDCLLKSECKYFKTKKKFIKTKLEKNIVKKYNLFCYINKNKKQIALTKKNKLGFLNDFYLPPMQLATHKQKLKSWKYHSKFNNHISNKKLNINLYYKFTLKNPSDCKWFSLRKNYEFIPSFTKKIFKQISNLN